MVDSGTLGVVGFAAGIGLGTFFAPCAYPLLPGYVGYYLGQEDASLSGAVLRGTAASVGALLALGLIAGLLVGLGQRLVSNIALIEPVIGGLLAALGVLYVLGRAPDLRIALPERRASVAGFGLFGAVYAVAAAGCVVPLFFGVVTRALTLSPTGTALVLASYAGAVALPLFGVTLLSAVGNDSLRSLSAHVGTVQRLAGGMMIVAGLWQVLRSLSLLGLL